MREVYCGGEFNVSEAKASAQRTGLYVFLALLVLTIAESIVGGLETPITVLLIIIALVKAALIVYFFMHVYRLWREESH
ncbi:MAG: hypothetical protein CL608_17855 [Anaerolineaceae bacterium]|nr:hypothetical protein [Anaerolineaceae bacterium]